MIHLLLVDYQHIIIYTKKCLILQHIFLAKKKECSYFAPGEMAEWSNAAVLKTVDCHRSGGSNPSLSASSLIKRYKSLQVVDFAGFFVLQPLQNVHVFS